MPRVGKNIYSQYDPEDMVKAFEAVRNGFSIRNASIQFNVPRSTLADRVSGKYPVTTRPGKKPVIPNEIESEMVKKVMSLAEQGFGVSRRGLLGRAGTVCKELNLKNNFKNGVPGFDWLSGLRRRHPKLVLRKTEKLSTVRSKMLNPLKVGRYFVELRQHLVENKLSPTEIWNMDETGLSLEHRPGKVLAEEGLRSVPGRTGNSREGVTLLPCVNAAGEKMPPLVIVKGKTERSLRSYNTHEGPENTKWSYQEKAWMTDALGIEWFNEIFLPNCGDKRPQLLIVDSHHSHETLGLLELARSNQILILSLPAHSTHYLCPLDRTVFGPFKREYDAVCSEYMSSSIDNMVNKISFPKLMNAAYQKVFKRSNIVSGFEATGIFNWNPLAIPSNAFAPAAAFDDKDIVVEQSEKELPGDTHPLQWVIRKVLPPSTTSSTFHSTSLSHVETLPHTATTPTTTPSLITVSYQPALTNDLLQEIQSATSTSVAISNSGDAPSSSGEIIPTYFSTPNHTSQDTSVQSLVNFNDSESYDVITDSDPMMTSAISDKDAAEILASLTAQAASNDAETVYELQNVQPANESWSNTWNNELEKIFSIKSSGIKAEKKKQSKIITSHRLLTSEEIINRKRKEFEEKERKEQEKKIRREKREEVKRTKLLKSIGVKKGKRVL